MKKWMVKKDGRFCMTVNKLHRCEKWNTCMMCEYALFFIWVRPACWLKVAVKISLGLGCGENESRRNLDRCWRIAGEPENVWRRDVRHEYLCKSGRRANDEVEERDKIILKISGYSLFPSCSTRSLSLLSCFVDLTLRSSYISSE